MFKGLSIIFLFTASTITGFYQASRLTRRKKLLIEYRDLLQRMETEIGYFKEPLPQLLTKLHTNINTSTDIFLRHCLISMEKGNETIPNIWKQALYETYQGEPLNASDLAIMGKVGSFIGQSDFQGQKGYFSLLESELATQIRDAEEICKRKGPLYSKAGLATGVILAIALL